MCVSMLAATQYEKGLRVASVFLMEKDFFFIYDVIVKQILKKNGPLIILASVLLMCC